VVWKLWTPVSAMQFLHQNWFLPGAVLCVAVGYYVSDFTHLVMWKVFLVSFYVAVARI
jgi:hypothetical protein